MYFFSIFPKQVFSFLKLMMVLLGSSCLSLAALILQCVPTWLACFFGEATKAMFKICFKNVQFWLGKLGSEIVKNEIAGLRHFLPRRVFFRFFLSFFCMAFWRSLGVSWAALGFLEALLGGLWTQKRVKTHGFLRFLKRLFEAPDGPLGLILAHSG